MYIFKNAYLNIVRSIGRNVLIGIIITVITISACITITINKSGNTLVNTYKDNNPLEVTFQLDTMNFRNATDDEKEEFNLLTLDELKSYSELKMVNDFYYTLQTGLNSDSISKVDYDELFTKPSEKKDDSSSRPNMPEGGFSKGGMKSNGDYTIKAYSDMSYNEDFVNGTSKLTDGEMISKDDTSDFIIISSELASNNSLSVGDVITFVNANNSDITYDLTIKGIYEKTTSTDSGPMNMMGTNSNTIYTTITTLEKIQTDDGDDENSFSRSSNINAVYYVDNENYDAFEKAVREKGLSDYYVINNNEDEVLATLKPIQNISSFSFTFLIIVLIVGGVVLTIINLFNIRERKYEIGVLRAIGMTKFKVTMQLAAETLMVAIVSLVVGTIGGILLSQPVSNMMLSSEIENINTSNQTIEENFGGGDFKGGNMPNRRSNKQSLNNVEYVSSLDVTTDFVTIIELFGVSMLLTLISASVAVMYVNKFEPNKILQNRG